MVATAQGADGLVQTLALLEKPVAVQLPNNGFGFGIDLHILLGQRHVLVTAEVAPRRYGLQDECVERVEINGFRHFKRLHEDAAADVNAHNVGNHLVAQIAREADHAARASVHIGHNADFAVGEHPDGEQSLDLFKR